jgi:hypothetical protein
MLSQMIKTASFKGNIYLVHSQGINGTVFELPTNGNAIVLMDQDRREWVVLSKAEYDSCTCKDDDGLDASDSLTDWLLERGKQEAKEGK